MIFETMPGTPLKELLGERIRVGVVGPRGSELALGPEEGWFGRPGRGEGGFLGSVVVGAGAGDAMARCAGGALLGRRGGRWWHAMAVSQGMRLSRGCPGGPGGALSRVGGELSRVGGDGGDSGLRARGLGVLDALVRHGQSSAALGGSRRS